jgi:hypothetical protein
MTDPVPVIRKRGRPRVPEPRSAVMTWVPVHVHDRLIDLAQRYDMSVSAVLRRVIVLSLNDRHS